MGRYGGRMGRKSDSRRVTSDRVEGIKGEHVAGGKEAKSYG